MLSPKQNLLETIRGGHPDRYVNQFEAFQLLDMDPMYQRYPEPEMGKGPVQNPWGVWLDWPDGTPGPFPLHDADHVLLTEDTLEDWRDYIKMPDYNYTEEEWAPIMEAAAKVDRENYFATVQIWPGLFETCHFLMDMETFMTSLYEEPEIVHDIIDMITEYELARAKDIIDRIHPDALYRHDDWGTQISTFISKDLFREFFLEPTKKIYRFWKDNGVQVVIHHNDAYGETLIPEMIEMGIDVWQGALSTNDLPRIAKEYKGQLTVMGGINNGIVDMPDWTPEMVEKETFRILDWVDSPYFIPNATQGCAFSTYPGVYETVTASIDKYNKTYYDKFRLETK